MLFGLTWLAVAQFTLTKFNKNSSYFELPLSLTNALIWLTVFLVTSFFVHEVLKISRRYVKWPLLITAAISSVLILTIGIKYLSFGPFVQPGRFYPPLSMPPKSFKEPKDFYLLALLLANAMLIVRILLENISLFSASKKDRYDLLDVMG